MKISAKKFMSETAKLERLLEDNYDVSGATLSEKVANATPQLPKGIVEKMTFVAVLYDRAKKGEKLAPADLKQAGYWIRAAQPWLSNGAITRRLWPRLIAKAVIALAAAYLGWRYASRMR